MSKLVYVTGGGRGIGRAIALALAKQNYTVSISARTLEELEETKRLSDHKIRIARVDATDYRAVQNWLDGEAAETGAIPWGLITAAGSYGSIGPFIETPFEEWEHGIELNLMGPAYAAWAFARKLVASKLPGRIVLLSGGGATQPLPNFTNYCASKSAIVRFGETLAHELKEHHISVNSIAPGMINTRFVDDVLKAGPEKAGKAMYERALKQKDQPGQSPDQAADLTVYLLKEETQVVTGKLISAVWDKWSDLHERWDEFGSKDWYTLKRSVPPEKPI